MTAVPTSPLATVREPGVSAQFVTSLVARLPLAAIGLLLVLRARDADQSYLVGGLSAAAFSVGMATGSPLLGRVIDRRGQARILLMSVAVAASGLLALGLLPSSTPPGVIFAVALVTGLSQPPLASCLRALWGRTQRPNALHALLTLDASLQELAFIFGPLVLVSIAGAGSPGLALMLAGAVLAAGVTAFALRPEVRATLPQAVAGGGGRAGALAGPGVRTLILAALALGASFGAIEVGIAAAAEAAGEKNLTGLLLVPWGLGSLVAGLLATQRPAPSRPAATAMKLLVGIALFEALLAAAPTLWLLAILLVPAGMCIAPMFAVMYRVLNDVAPPGTVTEAFAWESTGIMTGVALGAAAAGAIASTGSPMLVFLAAGAVSLLGALTIRARLTTLERS